MKKSLSAARFFGGPSIK